MSSICRLCAEESDLRESHIIPKFVFRWLKNSGSSYFRQAVDPNVRHQDGPAKKLLCASCEARFSERERYFANTLFYPVVNGQSAPFDYDERLSYFLISVLWRILSESADKSESKLDEFDGLFREAEEEWRAYLLGERELSRFDNMHLFITDILKSGTQPVRTLNVYLTRNVDATPIIGRNFAGLYVKFARFLLFALFTSYEEENWKQTKIYPDGGVLLQPQALHDPRIGEFLVSRARLANETYKGNLSPNQRQVIEEYKKDNFEQLVKSDLGRALQADAFNKTVPVTESRKIGRNEKCPCGSGRKFKHCHGKAT